MSPMDMRLLQLPLRVEHRHNDGSWGRLERREHTVVDHDPEREWANSRIYQCTTCDEMVRIQPDDDAEAAHG
jgi:hypothetical protein